MIFRPMTCDEIPRWYESELTEAFIPQERKPLAEIFRLREEGRTVHHVRHGIFGKVPYTGAERRQRPCFQRMTKMIARRFSSSAKAIQMPTSPRPK